jgi:esterase/lipase
MMKKFTKWLIGIIVVILIGFLAGPKPPKPVLNPSVKEIPSSLIDMEKQININEKAVIGLKPDNEARIVWADSTKKEKTRIALCYLHGFTGSQAEGSPVHTDIAKKYNANLYLARLPEHGIDRGDSTMINLTADKWIVAAEEALQITEKLGDEVVIIGTSAGGVLTLFLASQHPEIKAIILYSPCIKLYDKAAFVLNKPWGLQIARMISGGPTKSFESESPVHSNYWTLKFRIEGLVALVNLYSNTMKPEVLSKVKCPVFLAYYYKNEAEQDMTASVPDMLKMFEELGTSPELKQKMAFPEAGAHVIASYIRSNDWNGVEIATLRFLNDIVKL